VCIKFVEKEERKQKGGYEYSSIPGHQNWHIETAAWNLDVRLVKIQRNSIHA